MTPADDSLEDLRSRLRVLETENDLLADRAEDISLLGLVAEKTGTEANPAELLASVLEQVCILKAIPFGTCLESFGSILRPVATYHARRAEQATADLFRLAAGSEWPPKVALAFEDCGNVFDRFVLAGPPFTPTAVALVPLQSGSSPGRCLCFVDDRRTAQELQSMLPLLARVVDLTQARLDNLALVAKLRRLNLDLDLDVAERTEELRRSEERYRTLFDHVPDGVLLVDADDQGSLGRIEDANEAAAAMYGCSLADLKTRDIEALSAPGPGPRLESFEARVWRLKQGETVQEELTHRRMDGSTFPVEAVGTLVHIQGRQYVLVFLRDITERKKSEQALLRTQRVESLGVLAGGIAHDFNNLLAAILGQTGIALELMGDETAGRENLRKAMDAAEKAANLTKQMLAYSGRGKFTIQSISINHTIQDNLRILEAAISKQVKFELDLDEGLPIVTGDPSQIQQVVMNLVINAAEAIGEAHGCISIHTRSLHLDSVDAARWPLSGNTLAPGDYVRIEVADTGCGMNPEVLSRVFDPFFSTKVKGHGLGLSAVQGIIRAHRGGLGVDSEFGQGTTFRILLPTGAPDFLAEKSAGTGSAGFKARTVLVIDDEDYMLEMVRDSLEAHGHSALVTQSGEEGIDMLRLHGSRLDMVLLDLSMPGLGGVETFRRLRQIDPGIPVVLSSGFAEEEEAMAQIKGMELTAFLQKPYRIRDLIRTVESSTAQKGTPES